MLNSIPLNNSKELSQLSVIHGWPKDKKLQDTAPHDVFQFLAARQNFLVALIIQRLAIQHFVYQIIRYCLCRRFSTHSFICCWSMKIQQIISNRYYS